MTRRSLATAAVLAAVLSTTACSGGDGSTAPSPSTGSPSVTATASSGSPSASATASTPAPTSSSASPTLDPEAQKAAAFQLCGTVLALSAGFIGQVEDAQLAEGRQAVDQARAAYIDDGSGLLQKADAVVAAVDAGTTAKVVTTSKALATACQGVAPE